MTKIIAIQTGDYEITQPLEDFDVDLLEGGPLLRLVAAVRHHPGEPRGLGEHERATTLAIRMDPKAAIELAAKIDELSRKMGWPLVPQA